MFPIGLLSLVLFVELGIIAKSGPLPVDSQVANWFKAHRTPTEVQWAQVLGALTAPIIVLTVTAVIFLYLNYWNRSWYLRDYIPLALLVSCAVTCSLAKLLFNRLRPGAGLTTLFELDPSYPSSHVAFIASAGGALLIYVGKRQFRILLLVSLVTIFISLNRLTLGVHWFTDVVGSYFLTFGLFLIFYAFDDWASERESSRL